MYIPINVRYRIVNVFDPHPHNPQNRSDPETTDHQANMAELLNHADSNDDRLIVNYNDACIYGRDLKLFRSRNGWLNDACIHYQLARLQETYDPNKKKCLLLDPAVVSFLMHQCEDDEELADFLNGYDDCFSSDDAIVFLPIHDTMTANNASWNQTGQGAHWSLLVVDWSGSLLVESGDKNDTCSDRGVSSLLPSSSSTRQELKGYHFDSIPQSGNAVAAMAVAAKMQTLLSFSRRSSGGGGGGISTLSMPKTNAVPAAATRTIECNVPSQCNGYDCGVNVLATAEAVLQILLQQQQQQQGEAKGYSLSLLAACEEHLANLFSANSSYCSDLRRRIAVDILAQHQASKMPSSEPSAR